MSCGWKFRPDAPGTYGVARLEAIGNMPITTNIYEYEITAEGLERMIAADWPKGENVPPNVVMMFYGPIQKHTEATAPETLEDRE